MRLKLNFTPSVWKWKRKDKVFSAGGGWGKMLEAMPKDMHCKWSTSQESSQEPSSRRICIRRVCWIKPSLRASGCKRLLKTMTSSWPFRIKCLISITWRRNVISTLKCQCYKARQEVLVINRNGTFNIIKRKTVFNSMIEIWEEPGKKTWEMAVVPISPIMFRPIHTP